MPTRSVRGPGLPPMRRACRFFPAWCVTTKLPPGRFPTRFASRFRRAGPRWCCRPRIGRRNSTNANAPPMGMRLRLKAGYDISGFSANMQVILSAMKKYGLIMADNGSAMYISGAPDSRWDNDDLHNLGQVPASAFEVVQMNPVYTASNVPQGAAPSITSFTATPTSVSSGGSATLSWNVSNARYVIVSPQAGAVRGTSVTVQPRPDHYLHTLRHQPIRTQHRHRHSERTVARRTTWGQPPSAVLRSEAPLSDDQQRSDELRSTGQPGAAVPHEWPLACVRRAFPAGGDFRLSRYWPGQN